MGERRCANPTVEVIEISTLKGSHNEPCDPFRALYSDSYRGLRAKAARPRQLTLVLSGPEFFL